MYSLWWCVGWFFFFFQAEAGIRDADVTGVQTCALPISEERVLPGVVGLKGPLSCLTQARYGIAWGVIGAAQACFRQLLDYTATRTLFGRPLAANQTIQVRRAEMARRITTAQPLALHLARLRDAGVMHPAHVS